MVGEKETSSINTKTVLTTLSNNNKTIVHIVHWHTHMQSFTFIYSVMCHLFLFEPAGFHTFGQQIVYLGFLNPYSNIMYISSSNRSAPSVSKPHYIDKLKYCFDIPYNKKYCVILLHNYQRQYVLSVKHSVQYKILLLSGNSNHKCKSINDLCVTKCILYRTGCGFVF